MKKNIIISVICIIFVCTCLLMFTACDTGTYVYDGTLGSGTIKLGSFKKATISTEITGLEYKVQGKYTIEKKDKDGNKTVKIVVSVDEQEKTINAQIDKDGNLIVESIYRFMK